MRKKKDEPFVINMIRPGMTREEFIQNTIAHRLQVLVDEEKAERRAKDKERGKGNPLARVIDWEEMEKDLDEMEKRR